MLLQDLLRGREVAEKGAEDEADRDRVADRCDWSRTSRAAAASRDSEKGIRRSRRQRLLLAQAEPHRREQTDRQVDPEDRPPPESAEDRLPDRRRHDGAPG